MNLPMHSSTDYTLLSPMIPAGAELSALLVVVSFSAGLNVYATVGMLGILARFNVLALPPALHAVQDWKVIAACGALFLLEFVGDKIPVFDLLWNAAHTFVRVPVAAYLAFAATSQLPQWEQMAATFAGGLIALAAHGGKTAARAAVTNSPEPVTNFALSLGEDALVVFLMYFATKHPYLASAIVFAALWTIALLIHYVVRALRSLFSNAEHVLTHEHGNSVS
jgi:Domain of unknown function (DUF4126)